ncbi:MAG TPA: glycosyltransferase [Rhodopila sp.]
MARPRGFRIPPNQLRRFEGPVRVCGGGRDLTGSPLDPSAERRSAETATRMLAGLFPAPGYEGQPAQPDLLFLPVPAHVIGGPVEGGFTKRPVDVIIPVHGGIDLTLACLESVLVDLPRWAQVVVVDDASPDPRVAQELGKLAARHRITVLHQRVNRGFPGTANAGMRNDAGRDVVLLNSDTLVPPGWLVSLREAAYSASDIGSATPFSNDATILSYPSTEFPNAIPDLCETIYLDALSQKANAGHVVDIPTAVGFCTYIKRDCLNATGLLREDLFAQGYGEENDFCIRARHLGWRHVAVPGMFVAHVGGHSFGAKKTYLIERNLRTLNQMHPGYDALIQEFVRADPLAEPRRRLDTERWKTFRTAARSVLLITHGRSGGVRRHVAERAAALRAEGLRPIVIWPVASRDGKGRDCVLGNGPEGGTPNLRFSIPAELDLLTTVLTADHPVRAEVHALIGHDHRLLDLFRLLAIPYTIVIHDYSWFCPRINLVGAARRYCGEPDLADCEACIADAGSKNEEDTTPGRLRERSEIEMKRASDVIVSSEDVAARMRRHFPSIRTRIVDWEDDSVLPPSDPSPVAADGIRRVCVLGAIGIEKGYDMLLACARDAVKRKLKLRFHLVGHSCDDARLSATGGVHITGKYEEHEAVKLIRQQQTQLAWLPSLWPETWCYTLTQAWQAGLNMLVFDIGTPADRVRRTGRGWVVPLALTPERLNDRMLAL